MTNAMDNKEKAKLFFEHAKYCMQIKNYEKAEEFIHHAQKLYPTKEAEELLAELFLKKKESELADQEQGNQKRKSDFNLYWSRKERWQNMGSHQYYDTSTKFEVNMTENVAVIIGVGLGVLGTGLLVKSIFDIFDQHKQNKY